MKIAALGDSHVGRSAYPISMDGVNVRERDFEISFLMAIDMILNENPDLILLLGDIFDFPRPSYRSFRVVQKGMFLLKAAGIPVIGISGNHDTPRLKGTESPYAALHDVFPEFGLIYRQKYEFFDVGDVRIHGIPQMMTEAETLNALSDSTNNKSKDQINIVVTHPRLSQLAPNYSDINEIELDAEMIKSDFVLLGHYHFHIRVKERMWYAGSTDTFSFGDSPEVPKGFVVLNTDTGDASHVSIPDQRKVVDKGYLRAFGLGHKELEQLLLDELAGLSTGAVVRVRLDGVDPGAFRLLDQAELRESLSHLLHLRIEPMYVSAAMRVELPTMESMPTKWERFVLSQEIEEKQKELIVRSGLEYINKAIEAS